MHTQTHAAHTMPKRIWIRQFKNKSDKIYCLNKSIIFIPSSVPFSFRILFVQLLFYSFYTILLLSLLFVSFVSVVNVGISSDASENRWDFNKLTKKKEKHFVLVLWRFYVKIWIKHRSRETCVDKFLLAHIQSIVRSERNKNKNKQINDTHSQRIVFIWPTDYNHVSASLASGISHSTLRVLLTAVVRRWCRCLLSLNVLDKSSLLIN